MVGTFRQRPAIVAVTRGRHQGDESFAKRGGGRTIDAERELAPIRAIASETPLIRAPSGINAPAARRSTFGFRSCEQIEIRIRPPSTAWSVQNPPPHLDLGPKNVALLSHWEEKNSGRQSPVYYLSNEKQRAATPSNRPVPDFVSKSYCIVI
jgi:hypothetical protein